MKRLRTPNERLQMARQLLQQYGAMQRMALTPTEWIAFKLGCTYAAAEKMVAQLKAEAAS